MAQSVYVNEGFFNKVSCDTENIADALKARLTCLRWRNGCGGSDFIQDKLYFVSIENYHEPEMFEVKKKLSEIRNMRGITFTQVFDCHSARDWNFCERVAIQCAEKRSILKAPKNTRLFKGLKNYQLAMEKCNFGALNRLEFLDASMFGIMSSHLAKVVVANR